MEVAKNTKSVMDNKNYQATVKTYNKLGQKYSNAVANASPKAMTSFIKRLKKNSRILDVGCAGGRDMKIFNEKGFTAVGIDVSNALLKIAKKEAPKGKFFKMDVLELKFPKNYFDGVWADAVLIHLTKKDLPKALKNIYETLSDRGIFYASFKYGQGEKLVKEKPFTNDARFYSYYKKQELEHLLKKSGFKIIKSTFLADDLKRPGVKWISIFAKK